MARLRAGILGQLTGKVAGVVGATWKDKNYIREYVKPANPRTAAQVTQRNMMALCVSFCKPLVGPVFNAYTDRFQKSMSGFNYFIKQNIAYFDGSITYASVKLTEGKLSSPSLTSVVYTAGTGAAVFTFAVNYGNNGASSDQVFACVFDTISGVWYFAPAEVDRDSLSITVTLPTGLTPAECEAYLMCAKYANTLVSMNSYSQYAQCEAP